MRGGGGAIKICCAVGGRASPARDFTATRNLRVNRIYGFPLWGKLSPQVTDEGEPAGHYPLIRRVPRHLPPKEKAFVPAIPRNISHRSTCISPPFRGKIG